MAREKREGMERGNADSDTRTLTRMRSRAIKNEKED